MTIAVNVQGGTGAGSKRPLKEIRWTHDCKRTWRASENMAGGWVTRNRELTAYSCPDCGTRRPT